MTDFDQDLLDKASAFEASYKAHGPVASDPFYQAPADSADAAPGTLLKVEEQTDTERYSLPPGLSLSRFMYQSQTSTGRRVPVSGYVLWPYLARRYSPSGLPVVAWAHGTSGITADSAPSNVKHLWQHFMAPYPLALDGFAVVAPDYAGLGVAADAAGTPVPHEYLTPAAQGADVYYAVAAARAAFAALGRAFAVAGHSEGGAAAWGFAERQAARPLDGYLGAVPVSPVAAVLDLPDGPILAALVLMLAPALEAAYPGFARAEILTPAGVALLGALAARRGCNTTLFQLPFGMDCLRAGWRGNAAVQEYHAAAQLGNRAAAGPLLVVTGMHDEYIEERTVAAAVRRLAQREPRLGLEYYALPDVGHDGALTAGRHVWLDWIKARFEGRPVEDGLHERGAGLRPVRPGDVQQRLPNWVVSAISEPWMRT